MGEALCQHLDLGFQGADPKLSRSRPLLCDLQIFKVPSKAGLFVFVFVFVFASGLLLIEHLFQQLSQGLPVQFP